ncbi:MAG: hypothetical protein AAGD11_16745 [Planctomycetota bacterium]
MRSPTRRHFVGYQLLVIGAVCCLADARHVHGQLRVVSYNTATANTGLNLFTARSGVDTVLEAIGAETVGGIAKPIDVLLLQEQFNMATSAQSFVDILNDIYDPVDRTMYARSLLNGGTSSPDGSGGRPGLVYNTETVNLIGERRLGTVGGSAQARQTLRYQLRPTGYDSSADFYVYNNHYKAGTSSSDQSRRLLEAQAVRNDADNLGQGTHVIYAGDFNIQSSSEAMYGELLSAGNGQAFDPINTPGTWHNSSSLRITHTQAPSSSGPGDLVGGGVDDRFDFQLVTDEFQDDEGLSYISGTYRAFGNNGSHSCCGSSITAGNGASPAVLSALTTASDHLPVVADYQLPAVLSAQLDTIPATVPMGVNFSVDVLVENVANVVSSLGADELDFNVSVSGDLFGGGSGTDFALGGATAFPIMLDTSVNGLRSGTVTVTTASQGAANTLVTIPVSFSVGEVSQVPFLARDDFDAPIGLNSFVQSPLPGAFTSPADGFERYQVGISPSIPFGLLDQSVSGNASDTLGVVNEATKTDGWFGVTDLNNDDNPSGTGVATWEFDIAGASNLSVSIDMAAMGDFESSDLFDWTYAIDGGNAMQLFTSSVDEAGSATYTLADGDDFLLNDPLVITDNGGSPTQLSNLFQTLTSSIAGVGDTLTIQLSAAADGGSEVFAFDNIVIEGITILAEDADFDQDGDVDGADFLVWQRGVGTGTSLADGDANGDGQVDGSDLAVWQSQYANTALMAQQAVAAVPEPTTTALMVSALSLVLTGRRVANRHPHLGGL